ncbi:alanine--tRNA ligase-related protein, partial [Staphylococcus epidermidis]|uniref:alanine--tRNA ligase-related protein n=1 Tax=Staphylococcus epidermidis TaxID=1282 RepID=UPI0037D9BEC0
LRTNYQTHLFIPIINEVQHLSPKKYLTHHPQDLPFKLIPDHITTISFPIPHRPLPPNHQPPYVLTTLLPTPLPFTQSFPINQPFIYKLLHILPHIIQPYYPNL